MCEVSTGSTCEGMGILHSRINILMFTYDIRRCFSTVRRTKSFGNRKRFCLKRLEKEGSFWGATTSARLQILCAIPYEKERSRKPSPNDVNYDGAFHNDYLLNLLPSSRKIEKFRGSSLSSMKSSSSSSAKRKKRS